MELVECLGITELRYYETRSEPILRKILISIAKTIVSDLVGKIKDSGGFGLLTDEVTDVSNICQLVSFIEYEKRKTETLHLFPMTPRRRESVEE